MNKILPNSTLYKNMISSSYWTLPSVASLFTGTYVSNHYLIHNEMKNEFLNSAITWLFHLFEKNCNRILNTTDGNEKKKELENIGIDTSANSLWLTCNHELRLIANTIKHGKGNSSEELKIIKPNYFKQGAWGVSEDEVQLTIEIVEHYINTSNDFWVSFFSLALPEYE